MNGLTGMEKFSHLEDKIYLTIEYAKKMREEKERLQREADSLLNATASAKAEKQEMADRLAEMLAERDVIQQKIEAMLDAISVIDQEVAGAAGR